MRSLMCSTVGATAMHEALLMHDRDVYAVPVHLINWCARVWRVPQDIIHRQWRRRCACVIALGARTRQGRIARSHVFDGHSQRREVCLCSLHVRITKSC